MTLLFAMISVLPVLFLCISLWLIIKHKKKQGNTIHSVCLFLNIIFLLSIIVITSYIIVMEDLASVPAWVYWFLILSGIVIGFVSIGEKYVPGQMISVALLLFTASVTLFTIGIFLLILFVVEIVIMMSHLKHYWMSFAEDKGT